MDTKQFSSNSKKNFSVINVSFKSEGYRFTQSVALFYQLSASNCVGNIQSDFL